MITLLVIYVLGCLFCTLLTIRINREYLSSSLIENIFEFLVVVITMLLSWIGFFMLISLFSEYISKDMLILYKIIYTNIFLLRADKLPEDRVDIIYICEYCIEPVLRKFQSQLEVGDILYYNRLISGKYRKELQMLRELEK